MSTIINATTTNGVVIQPDNSGSLQLATNNGTTAVTIDASQNVTFSGNTTVSKSQAIQYVTSTTGTNSVYTHYTNTGGSAYVGLNNSTGGDFGNSAYGLQVFHGGAYPIVFSTNATERMRIDSSGNVLIATTSTAPRDFTSGSGVALVPSGAYEYATANSVVSFMNYTGSTSGAGTFITFRQQGAARGSISTNGSTTAYNTSSDYRLKENIVPITGALDKVALLKPVSYTWKETGDDSQGFIAHELQAVVPDCVTGEKDAVDEEGKPVYQGIDTSFLVATLTAAIQEQQTIINDLKARVTVLEAK